jgi:hypothetical protein
VSAAWMAVSLASSLTRKSGSAAYDRPKIAFVLGVDVAHLVGVPVAPAEVPDRGRRPARLRTDRRR